MREPNKEVRCGKDNDQSFKPPGVCLYSAVDAGAGEAQPGEPQAFLLMRTSEKKTAKQLANRRGIEGGEFEKLPFGRPDSIGNDGVAMRVEVGGECAKRLNGKDTSRPNVFTAKHQKFRRM